MKTILITGASSGFGQLTATRLLARGHTVFAGVRGGDARLAKVFSAEDIATGRLHAVDLHMEKPETFPRLDQLDVLINNAGYGALGPIEEQSEQEIRLQMDVNCVGPMLLTNHLLPLLRASKGRVLNITGAIGYVALPFYALYCASKFAMEGYSEALAYDLKPFGVQVGIVEPGGFRTGFTETAATSSAMVRHASPYKVRAAAMTHFLRTEAAKVNGDPDVVARALVRLCEKTRVPMRTKVGADAVALSTLSWIVPTRARMWLIDAAMSRTLFNTSHKEAGGVRVSSNS